MAGILDGTNQLFNAGMGILSANQRSPVYQNPVNSMQKGLMQGQLLKRQQQQDMMKQQEFEQAKRMKELQMQEIQAKMSAVPERKILEGNDGFNYYADTSERVLPDVKEKPSLPSGMRLNAAGQPEWIKEYLEGQERLRKAGSSKNTNTTLIEGTQIEDPIQKFSSSQIEVYNNKAADAYQREQDASTGLNILKNRIAAGDDTGKWAPYRTTASAYLGINPDDVANAQLFDIKMGDKVMARIAGTKGSVSEKEMSYFKEISAGSDKEPFTNYVLLEVDRRAAVREQDKLQYLGSYLKENKGSILNFDKWYMKNHDPFGDFSITDMRKDFESWSNPEGDLSKLSDDELF